MEADYQPCQSNGVQWAGRSQEVESFSVLNYHTLVNLYNRLPAGQKGSNSNIQGCLEAWRAVVYIALLVPKLVVSQDLDSMEGHSW